MSKRKRVGLDVDGVIAQFDIAYHNRMNEIQNSDIPYRVPSTWHWEEAAGFTRETVETFWETYGTDPSFWSGLPSMLSNEETFELIHDCVSFDVTFISKRPLHLTEATTKWLERNIAYHRYGIDGYVGHPLKLTSSPKVVLTNHKGLLAKALDLHYMIDDKPGNLEAVDRDYPACTSLLMDRRWNHGFSSPRVTRIYSLHEAFDIITRGVV